MSAPRPYERDSFHPPALFTYQMKIHLCIYAKLFQLFLPYGIYVLSWNGQRLRFTRALFQKPFFHVSNLFRQLDHNPNNKFLTQRARHARERNISLFLSSCVSSNESKTAMSAPIMPVVQANLVVTSKAKKMTNSTSVFNITRATKSVVRVMKD